MRLLFVKLKHIGDTLLLTPTLSAARAAHPQAEIWVVVRQGTEGILAGCPAIDHLLTAPAPEAENRSRVNWWREAQFVGRLRRHRFDHAFELGNGDRGRILICLSGARTRAAQVRRDFPVGWRLFFNHLGDDDPWTAHQVEMDYRLAQRCLRLPESIPSLQFNRNAADFSFVQANRLNNYIVIHPATRWQRKQWPQDRWVQLVRQLNQAGRKIVLSSGPNAAEVRLCEEIRHRSGADLVLTSGKLDWPQMAGLLYSSVMFIGVDTAAMHLAAACQTPTVALFGPSWEGSWRPWKVSHRLVTPQPGSVPETLYERIVQARGRRMEDITLKQVADACQEMLLEMKRA